MESTKIETAEKLLKFQKLVDANNEAELKRIKQKESPQSEEHKGGKYAENNEEDDEYRPLGSEPAPNVIAKAAIGAGSKRDKPRDFTADRDREPRLAPAASSP